MTGPITRPSPYNIEAEEAVIGSLLIDPDAIPLVTNLLTPPDFYREKHRWLYEAIITLHNRDEPADTVTLADELERRGKLKEVGGIAGISELSLRVPTAIHAEYYAQKVEEYAVLRRLIDAAEAIARDAYDHDDSVSDVIARAESHMFEVARTRRRGIESIALHEGAAAALARYEQAYVEGVPPGIPTHSPALNGIMAGGGLLPRTLTIMAGRPGMGKSSLMIQLALAQAQAGFRVMIFSLEMDVDLVMDRFISNLAQIDSEKLPTGDMTPAEWERVNVAVGELDARNYGSVNTIGMGKGEVIVCDAGGLTPVEMQSILLREMHQRGQVDVCYIDHMQEIGSNGVGRREYSKTDVVSEQVRAIRNTAKRHNVAMVLVAQLNRKCEERQDKRPLLSDLKDSGALEETADMVTFVYRDEVYNPQTDMPGVAEIIIRKQRRGRTGGVQQHYNKATNTWRDIDFHEPPPVDDAWDDSVRF